ncbi:MAG: hypothetical protein DI547_06125 [Sphingobium sp.]|jgi:hypothetical protein|nr:MAG: hypothetical protein DI547_06125 [Sphingobium sp.]
MTDPEEDRLQAILGRLRMSDENPVTRARRFVEMQVPVARRGPGWDRHWRELEAYAGAEGNWSHDKSSPDEG